MHTRFWDSYAALFLHLIPLVALYISMVWSQLLYYTQIWRPHLMKDILFLEQIQCHATKYLLNDYTSSYKTRLVKLKILPLMYLFELQDILFAIKSFKIQTKQLNIYNYTNFSFATTRSGTSDKMIIRYPLNIISRHSYFHRLSALWNALPIFSLDVPFAQLKSKLKFSGIIFWRTLMTTTIAPCTLCALVRNAINHIHLLLTWTTI